MKRLFPFIVLALAACADLRRAEPAVDGGTVAARDGGAMGSDLDAAASDAGEEPDAAKATCDGPCPPETIAEDTPGVSVIALDANNVYFATSSGLVAQCPKSGCQGAPLTLGTGPATSLAVAAGRVFWPTGDQIVSCAIGGCGNSPRSDIQNESGLRSVVTDGTTLVWSARVSPNEILRRAPANAVSKANITNVVTTQFVVPPFAVGSGTVLWATNGGNVLSCPLDAACPTPRKLGLGENDPVIAGSTALWFSANVIVSCPLSGCPEGPKSLASSTGPARLVSDGKSIYWRDELDDRIFRCSISGCATPEPFASDIAGGHAAIAMDAEYIYWSTATRILRRAK